ncbi:MAG: hypothetical protein ACTHMD_15700 [Flavisolibacter sp.]
MLKKLYILKALYFFSILSAGFYCYKEPFYNWDLLPYTALVLKMDHHSTKEAHNLAYRLAKENIPAKNYQQLTDSTHAYRNSMYHNVEAFKSQLPFYVVKPLYTTLIYLFYKSGIGLPKATVIPSLLSYLLIGLLLFYWLSKYLSQAASFSVALLVMVSPPLTEVTKTSSPDCLSAFLLFAAFYFIVEKPFLAKAFMLMLLSVFARLDNILSCFLVLCVIFFSKKWHNKVQLSTILFMMISFFATFIFISAMTRQYGWNIFFYSNFADRLHPAYGSGEHFSLESYGRLMYEHLINGLNHSYFALFIALLVLSLGKSFNWKKMPLDQLVILLLPGIFLLRFILYPDISDRFYVAFYLVIIIFLTKRLNTPNQIHKRTHFDSAQ